MPWLRPGLFSRHGGCVLLPDAACDGETYLTAAEGGEAFGVSAAAVRRWKRLGYLKAAVTDGRGRSLYSFTALAEAEKIARDAAIATSGTDKRVRRNIAA
jgi:hypothetical protein